MKIATPSAYFLYPVDWSKEPKLKRAWMTNVLSGLVGNEQRSKLKHNLTRTLVFTVVTDGEVMTRELKKRLRIFMPEIWGVAIPQYRMKITQLCVIGTNTLYVDSTVGCELSYFDSVLIGRWSGYEFQNVSNFTGTTITTRDTLIDAWYPGNFVYPVMRGLLADVQEFTHISPDHFEGEFTFVESFVWESD
jgi:hypothetical protein